MTLIRVTANISSSNNKFGGTDMAKTILILRGFVKKAGTDHESRML